MQPDLHSLLTEIFGPTNPELSSADHLIYEDLLEAYVLAEIGGEDVVGIWPDMSRHIQVCEQCRSEYYTLREIIGLDRMEALPDPPLRLALDWSFVDGVIALDKEERANARAIGWMRIWQAMSDRWTDFRRKRAHLLGSRATAKHPSAKVSEDSSRKPLLAPRRSGIRYAWMAMLVVFSCLLGTYFGYVRSSPVGWAAFSDLRGEDRIAYVELVALGYAQTGDLEQAQRQLWALGETEDVRVTIQVAEEHLMQVDSMAVRNALTRLVVALGSSGQAAVASLPTYALTPSTGETWHFSLDGDSIEALSYAPVRIVTTDSITLTQAVNSLQFGFGRFYTSTYEVRYSITRPDNVIWHLWDRNVAIDDPRLLLAPSGTSESYSRTESSMLPTSPASTPTPLSYPFILEGFSQYPTESGTGITAYIFSTDPLGLPGYSLSVRHNGQLLPAHKGTSDNETLYLAVQIDNATATYPYNLKVEYPVPSDGQWEVQLVDEKGDFVGPPAHFILSTDNPNRGIYLRYRQR